MKHLIFLLLVCSCLSLNAYGQSNKMIALKESIQQLHNAMLSGNGEVLDELTFDGLTFGHSGGKIEGKDSLIHHLVTGETDFISMEAGDPAILISQRKAWVRLNMKAEITDKGNRMSVDLKVLYVWIRQNGKWKLFARQAIKMNS
ncbi:MAG: nuclear transport factor 2 family protein [Sediminibacterium sp.]